VYAQEINTILMAEKTRKTSSCNTSYKDQKKKEIQALAQSLLKDATALYSRHTDVGKLLGLVSE
jgi:hypothetical protein